MVRVDETAPFKVNLLPSKNTVVTGVLGEGSCFLHALIYSMSPQQYSKLSRQERFEYISKLRENLGNSISQEDWLTIPGAQFEIDMKIPEMIGALYRVPEFVNQVKDKTLEDFEKKNPYGYVFNMREFDADLYKRRLGEVLGSEKIASMIVNKAIQAVYRQFIKIIKNPYQDIGDETFRIITKRLRTFVIFVKERDGDVYANVKIPRREFEEDFDHVVILRYIGDVHFETMGIQEDGRITRLFDRDTPFLQPLLALLVN
jgi:hypothetical protein